MRKLDDECCCTVLSYFRLSSSQCASVQFVSELFTLLHAVVSVHAQFMTLLHSKVSSLEYKVHHHVIHVCTCT